MNMIHSGLRRLTGVALMLGLVGLTACDLDELLTIEDRDTVSPATLEDPNVLPVVVNGAIGNFNDTFSSGESFLSVTALMSDEYFSAGTFTTRTATDRRNQFEPSNGNTSDGTYNGLHFARRALKDAAAQVADIRGTSDADYIELKALEGYTFVFLGEAYCSAVPISNVVDGEFVYGPPQTSAALLDSAVVRFDASLAGGSNHLAAVGKGRALLDAGNYSAAASAVAGVPTDFTYFVLHSQAGESNGIFTMQSNGRYSQSDTEGANGAPFRNPEDPRAPWTGDVDGDGVQDVGFDPVYPLYTSNKANDYSDPVVLSSGVEARLIEAEAALQSSDYVGMTLILNNLRADVADIMAAWVPNYSDYYANASLAPLVVPLSAGAARDMLFEERAFWLFLTGHRLGDLRRLIYQYGLSQDQVYPTGAYHKGGSYGVDVVFPLDFDEANNENFDHSMCDVTSASIN